MRYIHAIPEYRVVVPGRAVSFRSAQAKRYKAWVAEMAEAVFRQPLADDTVEVRVDYFHSGRRRPDMDNVAKCLLDALSGVAYVDDRQVRLQAATAYSLQSPVHIRGESVDLVKPLAQHEEYVFIRIRGYS